MAAEPSCAASYAVLRATLTAAAAVKTSLRVQLAAAAAAVAAATAAARAHPHHAFADAPGLALLDARGSLRFVTDCIHEEDALCLALTCRALRDALWARFPRRSREPAASAGRRLRTLESVVVTTVARLVWARDTGLLEEIETLRRDEAIGYRTGLEGFRGVQGFT
jgi:hypothetical protein